MSTLPEVLFVVICAALVALQAIVFTLFSRRIDQERREKVFAKLMCEIWRDKAVHLKSELAKWQTHRDSKGRFTKEAV